MNLSVIRNSNAYSIFANDSERVSRRRTAAGELMAALQALPEYEHKGPVRTAAIKCELAANNASTISDFDNRFCEVSELIYKAAHA
jgi:hypothetical protein